MCTYFNFLCSTCQTTSLAASEFASFPLDWFRVISGRGCGEGVVLWPDVHAALERINVVGKVTGRRVKI